MEICKTLLNFYKTIIFIKYLRNFYEFERKTNRFSDIKVKFKKNYIIVQKHTYTKMIGVKEYFTKIIDNRKYKTAYLLVLK